MENLQEKIAKRAYDLFMARGGQHGYHIADWLQAEKEMTKAKAPSAPAAAPSKPAPAESKAAAAPVAVKTTSAPAAPAAKKKAAAKK